MEISIILGNGLGKSLWKDSVMVQEKVWAIVWGKVDPNPDPDLDIIQI